MGDIQVAEDVNGQPQIRWRANSFLNLIDTAPATYAGHAGKLIAVKADETGVEFVEPAVSLTARGSSQDSARHASLPMENSPSTSSGSEERELRIADSKADRIAELGALRAEVAELRGQLEELRRMVQFDATASDQRLAGVPVRNSKIR